MKSLSSLSAPVRNMLRPLCLGMALLFCLPLVGHAAQDFVVLGEECIWVPQDRTEVRQKNI